MDEQVKQQDKPMTEDVAMSAETAETSTAPAAAPNAGAGADADAGRGGG